MSADHSAYLDTSALDALHLSQAAHAGIQKIATADEVMAKAASSMGLAVERF